MNTKFSLFDWGIVAADKTAMQLSFAGQMIGPQANVTGRRASVVDRDARNAQGLEAYETQVIDGNGALYSGKVLAVVADQANRHVAPTPSVLSGYNA